MPTRYILNSPVLTAYGAYELAPLTLAEARSWVRGEPFRSAVGHAGTATFLGDLLGVEVPASRITIRMEAGDEALIMRLLERLPEGKVLSRAELEALPVELGLLRRVR